MSPSERPYERVRQEALEAQEASQDFDPENPLDRLRLNKEVVAVIDALRIATRALDFYANPKHWREDDWGVRSVIEGGNEYGDPGKKARNAMKRIEKVLKAAS